MTSFLIVLAVLVLLSIPLAKAATRQSTDTLVGNLVLIILVMLVTIGALAAGVSKDAVNVVFGATWFAVAVFVYHYVCVRNRDRFVLYVKLTSKGGKGPGLFEKALMFFFGPYFGWSHGVWPAIMRKIAPKRVQPRKNV